jgi:LacI family transcriptional regulator
MAKRWATIRDVAQRAGVSVSTASKAVNNKDRVADATRRRVLQAATDLHFTPNALIRSLQQGKCHSIGIFIWDLKEDPSRDIALHLLKGMRDGIAAAGCDALLYSHLPERTPETVATTFLDGRVDGLILGPSEVDYDGLTIIEEAGIPAVVAYRREVPPALGFVDVDNEAGVTAAMRHLFALGHERIAFYAPYFSHNYRDRATAYRQALLERGHQPDPALCLFDAQQEQYDGSLIPLTVEAACEQLLALPTPPTALIAGDDAVALEWLHVLAIRGVQVPRDLSLIGFDDAIAAGAEPGLTTVRQPVIEVGCVAAQFVDTLIQGGSAEQCRAVLPVELIVRGTTAPPNRAGRR